MLTWVVWAFQLSQFTMLAVLLMFLAFTVWREYHLGNDLTYWGLARLLGLAVMCSVLGVLLPLFVWAMNRTGYVEIERGVEFQNNSVYELVGKEKILLAGSRSAKVMRNLTADWEKEW